MCSSVSVQSEHGLYVICAQHLLTEECYWVLFYMPSFTLPTVFWMYYYSLQINWVFLTKKKLLQFDIITWTPFTGRWAKYGILMIYICLIRQIVRSRTQTMEFSFLIRQRLLWFSELQVNNKFKWFTIVSNVFPSQNHDNLSFSLYTTSFVVESCY
jgi:hypothetical protein